MNKKVISAIILLTCLVFMPITTSADYPTGELGYSDEIAVGEEFEWTVSKLEVTGDFDHLADRFYIGDTILYQGDKIKIKILEDPDEATDIWFDIYVNDIKIIDPDPYFVYIIWRSMYYTSCDFFITPVTYTNATGTYNLYEQTYEELEDRNYDNSDSYSEVYDGVTYEYTYSKKFEFKLQGDVFSIYRYYYESYSIKGNGYDESWYWKWMIETTINIRTGLVGKAEILYDLDEYDRKGKLHLLIDSDYAKTPYEWAYSFLGITVIAAVVALVKRKRK